MCILLWTTPSSNHPRFKFAFASNRDEFMNRETSRADFWDIDSILGKATRLNAPDKSNSTKNHPTTKCSVGILSGQDLQGSTAENYTIREVGYNALGEEHVTLTLSTKDVPGTWLGISTHGDLVALTNYREAEEYYAQYRAPKLSRGKVCGEYLVTMASERDAARLDSTGATTVPNNRASQWITRRAIGWDKEFEGLNLLVVQNSGEQQSIGGNREGCELTTYGTTTSHRAEITPTDKILQGSVVGVSNSVFMRPWNKIHIGVNALEKVLNDDIALFGKGPNASLGQKSTSGFSDETLELAWLVIEMLTLLRVNTTPFPKDTTKQNIALRFRERVFIPRFGQGRDEYGTRSSTIVLFGRNNGLIVYVEKVWYGPCDKNTGMRPEFAADSHEGIVWWQGLVGQPKEEWKRIDGQELESLIASVKDTRKYDNNNNNENIQ
ncbi:hypothetical protein BGZ76_007991 [Entomortierella beljakovae]|nr:hypothetical protein BGZ76_007991 [Entomortierella beljakovae]